MVFWHGNARSYFAGVFAVVQSKPGQVQGCRVVVQDEFGVGGQEERMELEGEPVGVLVAWKLVLLQRGGCEAPEQRRAC